MFPRTLPFMPQFEEQNLNEDGTDMAVDKLLTVVAVATLAGLAGCPVTQINRLPSSSPLAQATSIPAVGDFKHGPSGFSFPDRVGVFQRVDLLRYDSAGLDVSAGYNDELPNCLVALTTYVFPTPRMTFIGATPEVVRSTEAGWLEGAYREAKRQIAQAHADATLDSEDAETQDGVLGKKAIYSFGAEQSELSVFVVRHSWFLQYRATYPGQCAAQARQALDAFHAAWTDRANST